MPNSNDNIERLNPIPESVAVAAAAALCERVRRYHPYQTNLALNGCIVI